MSIPDPAAVAALDAPVIKPVFFAFLDIVGDPVRANTSGHDIIPSGTGDADLDGKSFSGISAGLVDISSVKFGEGGSDSVTAELSGVAGIDDDTLEQLSDPANWQGRNARLWRVIRDAANVQQGGFHAFYTGKMTALTIGGSPESQRIRVTIESYLAILSAASNRTYMDQARFDPGDQSARAAIAIANGNYTGAPTGGAAYGAGGGVGDFGSYGGPTFQDSR